MGPLDGARPVRVKGTVDIELEDGRVATLEVDLDVSGRDSGYAIDNRWDEERLGRDFWWDTVRPTNLLGTAYTLYVDEPLTGEVERPIFTLRIPNREDI